jgi:hypothetical protein
MASLVITASATISASIMLINTVLYLKVFQTIGYQKGI